MTALEDWLIGLEQASTTPNEPGRASALQLQHGSMTLRWYAPSGHDPQTPHDQDEVYVVVSGAGQFALGRDETSLERQRFGPGDAIFVPAGWVHRFEDFTGDFATWVVFYGPPGGEAGPASKEAGAKADP